MKKIVILIKNRFCEIGIIVLVSINLLLWNIDIALEKLPWEGNILLSFPLLPLLLAINKKVTRGKTNIMRAYLLVGVIAAIIFFLSLYISIGLVNKSPNPLKWEEKRIARHEEKTQKEEGNCIIKKTMQKASEQDGSVDFSLQEKEKLMKALGLTVKQKINEKDIFLGSIKEYPTKDSGQSGTS